MQGRFLLWRTTTWWNALRLSARNKIQTIPVRNFDNEHIIGLMRLMKSYEKLAVEAAVTGDRQTAIAALMLNPLCGDYRSVSSCYDEMRKVNEKFLN